MIIATTLSFIDPNKTRALGSLLKISSPKAIKSPDTLRTAIVNFYKFKTKEVGSDILIALGEVIIKRAPNARVLLGSIIDNVVAIILLGKKAVLHVYPEKAKPFEQIEIKVALQLVYPNSYCVNQSAITY